MRWDVVCSPKGWGGLGVKDLGCMNIALLCKWLWRLETSDGMWQNFMYRKYDGNKTLSGVEYNNGDSCLGKEY